MAIDAAERLMSAVEFLQWEREQPDKFELIDNRIIATPGSSPSHNLINFDLAFALKSRLLSKGCRVYGIDIQLQVDRALTYTYPDVAVACGEQRFRYDLNPPILENPALLFEILSPSTEMRDRGAKLDQYLRIPSLIGYFLVAQDQPLFEGYQREGDQWLFGECAGLGSSLVIPDLDCEIPLSEVYAQVSFR